MTNEERAKEIANETLGDFATSFLGMIDEYSEMFCTEAALRAAEWKDQQLKEYLEKKRMEKSLGSSIEEYGMGFKDSIDYILDEIINELFKEK